MHVELKKSSLPDSVKPPNAKFISYNNLKRSVASSSVARMHPWVDGALTITGKLRKEIMDLSQKINKLEEENHILKGIIAKNIAPPPPKKETWVHGYGHSPWLVPILGDVPRYRITTFIIIIYVSSVLLVKSWSSRIKVFSMI